MQRRKTDVWWIPTGACTINNKTDLTGYYEDKDFFTTRGDARVSAQLARTKYALKLGRTNRFLMDDPDAPHKLAYQLTKPMKGNLTYNNKGTYSFVLQEVQTTKFDNVELGIADYYKHFPKPKKVPINPYEEDGDDDTGDGTDTGDDTGVDTGGGTGTDTGGQDSTQDGEQEHKDEHHGKKVYI